MFSDTVHYFPSFTASSSIRVHNDVSRFFSYYAYCVSLRAAYTYSASDYHIHYGTGLGKQPSPNLESASAAAGTLQNFKDYWMLPIKLTSRPLLHRTTRQMSLQVLKFALPDVTALTLNVVPPLDASSHKGTMGRVGVVGGSKDYCGAPYYAAVSALKFGADLSWVYCSQEAAIPIKSYSPELMVTPFYDDKRLGDSNTEHLQGTKQDIIDESAAVITSSFPRLHTMVIGPGLGRHPDVQLMIERVLEEAVSKDIGFVIDADGLNMLTTKRNSSIAGYNKCILTPNAPEFERLASATLAYFEGYVANENNNNGEDLNVQAVQYWMQQLSLKDLDTATTSSSTHGTSVDGTLHTMKPNATTSTPSLTTTEAVLARRVYALSVLLGGVTILRKGEVDIIASSRCGTRSECGGEDKVYGSSDAVYVLYGKGCPRRCGGLGDILSGITATALHWATQRVHLLPDLSSALADNTNVHQQTFPIEPTQTMRNTTTATIDSSTSDPTGDTSSTTPSKPDLHNALIHACIFASTVAKRAAELAFADKGRSMTAPDVIERIGSAFQDIYKE